MSHFKVFRSVAYAHVPDQRRTKLEDKIQKYILIGYDEKMKGYRLFDPINKKVIVSRDVRVNEGSRWDWENLNEVVVEVPYSISKYTSTGPEDSDDEEGPSQPRLRSLQDLYENT